MGIPKPASQHRRHTLGSRSVFSQPRFTTAFSQPRDRSDSHAHAYKKPARRRQLCRGLVVQRYRTVLFVGMSLLFCRPDPLILSHTGKGFNQCWMGKVLYGRNPLPSQSSAEVGGPVAQERPKANQLSSLSTTIAQSTYE
jgi:hypothetical protein